MAAILAGALLPILVQSGAGMLAGIVRNKAPGAAKVIERIAGKLGTAATEQAIADRFREAPAEVAKAIVDVEQSDPETWSMLAAAAEGQRELLAREDQRESAFSWAWRPAMSWLLLGLWLWNGVLLPLVNAIAGASVPAVPWDQLLAFSGLWLAIYGGGNTIKSVMGARK